MFRRRHARKTIISCNKHTAMKWIEAKVEFDCTDTETAVDVIAGVFYDLGLKGVVIDDPGMEPAEDWGKHRLLVRNTLR